MSLRTKNAICESFLDLLNERPFDKISIRDIIERSQVSRSTFYYYYQDIYALTEDIFEAEIEKVTSRVGDYDSWQKVLHDATAFASANRTAILHIYESANRELLEYYYHKTILTAMLSYVHKEAEDLEVPERKILVLAKFYAAALTSLSLDWLGSGMKDGSESFLEDLSGMLDGNVRQALERAAAREEAQTH